MKRKTKSLESRSLSAYKMLMPFLILFAITILLPTIVSFFFSFMDISNKITWTGFDNFKAILKDPILFKSYANVFTFMIFSIPITIFLALIFAIILNKPSIKGKGFFRTVYYLPAITSIVAITSVFLTFYEPTGLFNKVIGAFGMAPIPWLSDPFWVKVSIIILSVWLNVGYYTVLFLAGLQNISGEVYESADIDGAGAIRQFFQITIPLLKPVILMAIILSTINGLGSFEVPNILFKGSYGPQRAAVTVGVNLYKTSFELVEFGRASAISWTMVGVSSILSIVQFVLGGKNNES